MEMIYDDRIKALETKISYGTLGVLNTLVIESDLNIQKTTMMLINLTTIVRNCYSADMLDHQIIKAVSDDIQQIYTYAEAYNPEITLLFYADSKVRMKVPEHVRRKLTDIRINIDRITDKIIKDLNIPHGNALTEIYRSRNMPVYFVRVEREFSYQILSRLIRNKLSNQIKKVWLVSHCAIDYYLYEVIRNLTIIDSHTGKITVPNNFGKKVFRDDIPFRRITHMLFGDKEYIAPVIKNRNKALEKLRKVNIKIKTERELTIIAMKDLGVMPDQIAWKL